MSTASDGVEGLHRIRELAPELVLSDVMMPRMDGFELCRRVRATEGLAALPFILLTARGELEDLVGGLHLGAADYVTKPFHLSELRARIESLLQLRRAERQAIEREARLAAIEAVAEEGEGGVLDAIRSLARLRVGQPESRREVTPLSAWLDEVLEPLHVELWERGVQVHLRDDSGGAAIARIDRRELESVLRALVRNAGEAVAAAGTQDGIRHVFLTLDAATDVRIRVADDGPGTPLELARRLFTPQRDRSELVRLRDAIQAQGGRLGLEVQAPEGGAAFTIRLPASAPEG
ncbi:MAG: response regulator [Proteobacteria bacterium]|nr:response regulator [Pseudomonadota bacterium]MCP4920108.1 response regulator [Pseudomonadota bacterium]